jgi:hypothetical protein
MGESTLSDDVAQRIGAALGNRELTPEDLADPAATAASTDAGFCELAECDPTRAPLGSTEEELAAYIRRQAAEAGWFVLCGLPVRLTTERAASSSGQVVLIWQGEVFGPGDLLSPGDVRIPTALAAVREAGHEWPGAGALTGEEAC